MAVQDEERERRLGLWDTVKGLGLDISARSLRDLGVYGGAQGIWVDKTRTGNLAPDGVTVGLLHTGRHYPDDHYPSTSRPASRDAAEVEATKNAARLGNSNLCHPARGNASN